MIYSAYKSSFSVSQGFWKKANPSSSEMCTGWHEMLFGYRKMGRPEKKKDVFCQLQIV